MDKLSHSEWFKKYSECPLQFEQRQPSMDNLEVENYDTLLESLEYDHHIFTMGKTSDNKHLVLGNVPNDKHGPYFVQIDKIAVHQLGRELIELAEEMVI